MITRRRSRAVNNSESVKVEAVEAMDPVDDLSDPSEALPAEDIDASGAVLEDLLGFEDITWTLERDSVLPLFDMELADLGIYCGKDQDSGFDASAASSPERVTSDSKIKHRENQSSCMINKNAIAARMNRLKKKEYVNSLEKKVAVLSSENNTLKQEKSQLGKRVEELEDETRYLRAVLANESMLAQLLSRLSGVNGMKLSSSLFQGPDANDHDYALPRKRVKVEEKKTSGGVCLHVDKNHVSVEFCTKCAESASTSLKM